MNADGFANGTDFTLLLGFARLLLARVTAVVDSGREELDVRGRLDRCEALRVAEGSGLRDELFMVRHIRSLIAASVMLLVLAWSLPLAVLAGPETPKARDSRGLRSRDAGAGIPLGVSRASAVS